MTEIQILQILGIIYAAVGLGILLNRNFYQKLFEDFVKSPALVYFAGAVAAVTGYTLISFYNTWADLNSIIVGVVGWAALIKGVTLIILPKFYLKIVQLMKKRCIMGEAILILAIGAFLLYLGFWA